MDLLTPSYSLIAWELFLLTTFVLFIVSWIRILISSNMDSATKLVWLLGTLCLPIIGPILLFFKFPKLSRKH